MRGSSVTIVAATAVAVQMISAPTVFADDAYDRCIGQATTNVEFSECGAAWVKREDDKLNATWKRVHGMASGQTRTDLLAEQRVWVPFKEKACAFYANGDWGREGATIGFPTCQAGIIADRTEEIEAIGEFLKPQ